MSQMVGSFCRWWWGVVVFLRYGNLLLNDDRKESVEGTG